MLTFCEHVCIQHQTRTHCQSLLVQTLEIAEFRNGFNCHHIYHVICEEPSSQQTHATGIQALLWTTMRCVGASTHHVPNTRPRFCLPNQFPMMAVPTGPPESIEVVEESRKSSRLTKINDPKPTALTSTKYDLGMQTRRCPNIHVHRSLPNVLPVYEPISTCIVHHMPTFPCILFLAVFPVLCSVFLALYVTTAGSVADH